MRLSKNSIMYAVAALLYFVLATSAMPDPVDRESRRLSAQQIKQVKVDAPVTTSTSSDEGAVDVDQALYAASGLQQVIVQLKSPSVARARCNSMGEQMSRRAEIEQEQSNFIQRIETSAPSAKQLACIHTVLNAVFFEINADEIEILAADPDVVAIHQVVNYELDLSETVPYVGGTAVREEYGFIGTGVKVAVLDSGIDYTHADFGGPGTVEAYNASISEPATRGDAFPTDMVIEGYDFVGELFPFGPILPDDDPIDAQGHGTSVASIAAGLNGVAPGASLVAVKVCSAVGLICGGMAVVQGIEYAVDPNGDGNTTDRVDVMNLSFGGLYGIPFDHDVSFAVENAAALGVLAVASAGNQRDRPYIVEAPGSTPSAISVAETQLPSAFMQIIEVVGESYRAVFQPWSTSLESTITAPIQFGDGNGRNELGCQDFESGSIEGKIVLVDRGNCTFSAKISKISQGGGLAGIIGLIDDQEPFAGSDAGDRPIDIPGYMLSQADSEAMKAAAANGAGATIDPSNQLSLAMQMVSTSSRGPQHQDTTLIKPEIGAPGRSVAASVGTGTETKPFSGTSGAAPMVTGAAALLQGAYPELSPAEVKARLMNNAYTEIKTNLDSGLAPISRIGGGELRVDRALAAPAAAWDENTLQGALSFGFIDVDKETRTLYKRIRLRNYSDRDRVYAIRQTFRYDDDKERDAVDVSPVFPGMVQVRAGQDRVIRIKMTIRGALLESNYMSSGQDGANPDALTRNEYDGFLILDDGMHPLHLAWHVLPRKAASVIVEDELNFTNDNPVSVGLRNEGVGIAQIDPYSLLALSENLPEGGPGELSPTPDIKAVGIRTIEVEAGVCSDSPSFIWGFAISTWERQQHLIPVRFVVYLDMDQDGIDDYEVLNSDFSRVNPFRTGLDGRQVAWAVNLETEDTSRVFFAEHAMNTANTGLFVCAEQLGMTLDDLLKTQVDIRIEAQDWYYRGPGDSVGNFTVTPGGERYFGELLEIWPNESGSLTVADRGPFAGNTEELGLMLFTNGDRGEAARGGATPETELKILLV